MCGLSLTHKYKEKGLIMEYKSIKRVISDKNKYDEYLIISRI